MAKKYKLNINGGLVENVNFNGTAWTGPLEANGVDVSYEDAPVAPPPPDTPRPNTVWKLSAAPNVPISSNSLAPSGLGVNGPLELTFPNRKQNVMGAPIVEVSGSLVRSSGFQLWGNMASIPVPSSQGNPFVGREHLGLPLTGAKKQPENWYGKWVGIVMNNAPIRGGYF